VGPTTELDDGRLLPLDLLLETFQPCLVQRPVHGRGSSLTCRTTAGRLIDNDGDLLVAAMALQQRASLALWDALIVEAATAARCDLLYSEDFNPRPRFGSVEIVNPFQR
jgi:hypothetical protein